MSLNRIAKRRAFKASQPSVYAYLAAERLARAGLIGPPAKRQTYHEYAVATGDRHPTFSEERPRRARRARPPSDLVGHEPRARSEDRVTAPAPYQPATPKAVCSFLASLCIAAGDHRAAEAHLVQLLTLLAIPRAPTAEVIR